MPVGRNSHSCRVDTACNRANAAYNYKVESDGSRCIGDASVAYSTPRNEAQCQPCGFKQCWGRPRALVMEVAES